MTASVAAAAWTIDDNRAHLLTNGLRGRVDLRHPEQGIFELTLPTAARPWRDWRLLSVVGERPPGTELVDAYIRGGDLVATYGPRDEADLRRQVYWRVVSAAKFPEALAVIDAQVSVQTPLLDSCPATAVESSLLADDVRRMASDAAEFEASVVWSDRAGEIAALEPPARSCWLFRPSGATISYVEMIHPVDLHRDTLRREAGGWTLSHGLFVDKLEKGVILRSRVRGAFLPRDCDEALAAEIYAAFAAEPPPLTT